MNKPVLHRDEHGVCVRHVTAVVEFRHLVPGAPPTRGEPSADGPSAYGRDPHGPMLPDRRGTCPGTTATFPRRGAMRDR